ncbi:phosphopantetheine-binding protein [Streptomyces sp. NK08204]|uniref:phosphopantetheine-binding protein n=1 Tax=Streptomyces sp. NK08204 TaxID=2873260 RepID=UPI001CECCFF6|nr:phosphopantetheine-binding protein [Streptomyces sp. NK08204]
MSGTHRQPPTVTTDEVRNTVAAALRMAPSDIGDDTDLVKLGLDSLRMMRLSGRWRRSGLKADFHTLTAEPTVRAWARHLSGTATEPAPTKDGGHRS